MIVALGVYPHFVVHRTEKATTAAIAEASDSGAAGGAAMTIPLADVHAPVIDYKALSPLMATVGGSIVVLMVGLFRGRFVQLVLCRCSRRSRCSPRSACRSGSGTRAYSSRSSRAR